MSCVDKSTAAVHSRTQNSNPWEGTPMRQWPGAAPGGSVTSVTSCTAVAHECAAREKKIGALCTLGSPAAAAEHLLWCSFHLLVLHVFKIHVWFVFLNVLQVKRHLKEEKNVPKIQSPWCSPCSFCYWSCSQRTSAKENIIMWGEMYR